MQYSVHCVSGFVQLFIPVYIPPLLDRADQGLSTQGVLNSHVHLVLCRSALAMTTCSLLIYCLRQTSL